MNVTNEILQDYVGGQLEIQSQSVTTDVYRGEIETIELTDERLTVRFRWLGRMGHDGWYNEEDLNWFVSRDICKFSDIGDNRLLIDMTSIGNIATCFPPGGSRLDPSRVKGLVLPPKE